MKISKILFDILNREIKQIETKDIPKVSALIISAKELGDYRENEELASAQNDMKFLKKRLSELKASVDNATVVEYNTHSSFDIGSLFELYRVNNGEKSYKGLWLLDSQEAPNVRIISDKSMLGSQLSSISSTLVFDEEHIIEYSTPLTNSVTWSMIPRKPTDIDKNTGKKYSSVFEEYYLINIKTFKDSDWVHMYYFGNEEHQVISQYNIIKSDKSLTKGYLDNLSSNFRDDSSIKELHLHIIKEENSRDNGEKVNYFLELFEENA